MKNIFSIIFIIVFYFLLVLILDKAIIKEIKFEEKIISNYRN